MSDTPGQMAPKETPLYSFMPNGSAMYMVTVFKDCIEMRVDGRVIRKPIAGWCEAVNSFSDDSTKALDAAIRLADMSVQEIKLMAGEMTAGELRAVRAVVKGIVARLSALREAAK